MATFSFTVENDLVGPVIDPIFPLANAIGMSALEHIRMRFSDELAVSFVSVSIQVNGVFYVIAGAAQAGATYNAVGNAYNGYDVTLILPAPMTSPGAQEVSVSVADTEGNQSTLDYRFYTGVGMRLLSVKNPREGVLVARFNRPLRHGDGVPAAANMRIQPVSPGARELIIVEALVTDRNPDVLVLLYEGGGSTYQLTVLGLVGEDGESIEAGFDAATFEIFHGTPLPYSTRVFDTVFGPIGLAQRPVQRRSVEALVASRATALAMDVQFKQRLAAFGDGTAGRDGRMGGNRT